MLETLPLPGADLRFDPCWMAAGDADALAEALHLDAEWEVHRLRLFGRWVDSPRLSCWIGDADARYRYSGALFEPRPWPTALLRVRQQLQEATGARFNSVLANLYRNGQDAMGWHSDDEAELGRNPLIASLSLGATRKFALRHRTDPACKLALQLGHGSLLIMAGDTQRNYRHALPRTARPVGARINLTFRQVGATAS